MNNTSVFIWLPARPKWDTNVGLWSASQEANILPCDARNCLDFIGILLMGALGTEQ